jgi:hypothetical protein
MTEPYMDAIFYLGAAAIIVAVFMIQARGDD